MRLDRATPLHLAVRRNDIAAISLLIRHGANLRAKDNAKRMPVDDMLSLCMSHFGASLLLNVSSLLQLMRARHSSQTFSMQSNRRDRNLISCTICVLLLFFLKAVILLFATGCLYTRSPS